MKLTDTFFDAEEEKEVLDCLRSGNIAFGTKVAEFEKKFSSYIGTKYGIMTSNGTAAIHMALLALGIGKNDEVIVPSVSYIGTSNPVAYIGAKIRFADVEKDIWNMDASKIKERITPRTKAIIPVHLYGHPCDMGAIKEIAEEHNLFVIEDCAEAVGAEYNGRKVGSFSDISCFSFHESKVMTTGEGGICLFNDEKYIDKLNLLRFQGKLRTDLWKTKEDYAQKQFLHQLLGYNYKPTNIQAAIGLAQLKKIDRLVDMKRQTAARYMKALEGLPITLPIEKEYAKSIYWLYTILAKSKESQIQLMDEFRAQNVPARSFFYPLNKQPFYGSSESCPVGEDVSSRGISLPSPFHIDDGDLQLIRRIIQKAK
jgi:perosamine synthetase